MTTSTREKQCLNHTGGSTVLCPSLESKNYEVTNLATTEILMSNILNDVAGRGDKIGARIET